MYIYVYIGRQCVGRDCTWACLRVWYIYRYICIYMHLCIYMFVYIYVYVCIYMYRYVSLRVWCLHIHTPMYTHTPCIQIYMHICIYIFVYMYVYIYAYVCMYMYRHVYLFVYKSARPNESCIFPSRWIDFTKVFYLSFITNL